MLEIIAETVADALAAQRGGATQLDLECSFLQGGLTPSMGLIEQVCATVDIDVLPLIRPHSRDVGFVYAAEDVAVMCADVRMARQIGTDGFLVGCLTANGGVDVAAMEALRKAAGDCPLHFHIGWELAADPAAALESIIELGVESVRITGHGPGVTAVGGKARPDHPIMSPNPRAHGARTQEQIAHIRRFVGQAAGRIDFVVVGGVSAANVRGIVLGTGVPNVHSGSGVREPPTRHGAVHTHKVAQLAQALKQAAAALVNG